MHQNLIKRLLILTALFVSFAIAQEKADSAQVAGAAVAPEETGWKLQSERSITFVDIFLPHYSLKHSDSYLKDWPFIEFAIPFFASQKYTATRDVNKLVGLKGEAAGTLSVVDLSASAEVGFSLIHLLEFSVLGKISTAWNYGYETSFMGRYNPKERDFDNDISFTEYMFDVQYKGGLTIPVLAFLPKSNWTKIIVRTGYTLEYLRYTGARDGQLWRAGVETSANGYKSSQNITIIYMLPYEHIKMFMLSLGRTGFLHDSDFDEVYKPYDPDFKTYSVNPMLQFTINAKWSGMAMAMFGRERKFENDDYYTNERFLQTRDGHEWAFKMAMIMLTYKF